MGWWDLGGGDVMGDGPAGAVGHGLDRIVRDLANNGDYLPSPDAFLGAWGEALRDCAASVELGEDTPEGAERRLKSGLYRAIAADELEARPGCTTAHGLERSLLVDLLSATIRDVASQYMELEARKPRATELVHAFLFVLSPAPGDYLALRPPLPVRPIVHPTVRFPLPTCRDLAARMNPAARTVLTLAARFARWRVAVEAEQGALPSSSKAIEECLTRADFLRALVATQSDAVGELLSGFADELPAMHEHWASRAERLPPARDDDLGIDLSWAIWWAHGLSCLPAAMLGVGELLGALDERALTQLFPACSAYNEELLTTDELLEKSANVQLTTAGWGIARPLPIACFDPSRVVAEVADVLARGRPVMIVGENAAARTEAIFAAATAINAHPFAPRAPVGEPLVPDHEDWEGRPADGVLFAPPSFENPYGARRVGQLSLQELSQEMSRAEPRVLATTREGEARLRALPEVTVYHLPALRDVDLVPLWLATRGRRVQQGGRHMDVVDLLCALEKADEADRFSLDWATLEAWSNVPSRCAAFSGYLSRLVRRGDPVPPRALALRFVARFVECTERLRGWQLLDAALP